MPSKEKQIDIAGSCNFGIERSKDKIHSLESVVIMTYGKLHQFNFFVGCTNSYYIRFI